MNNFQDRVTGTNHELLCGVYSRQPVAGTLPTFGATDMRLDDLLRLDRGGLVDGNYVLTFRGSTKASHSSPYWNAAVAKFAKLRQMSPDANLVLVRRDPEAFAYAVPLALVAPLLTEARQDTRNARWLLHIRGDRLAIGNDWNDTLNVAAYAVHQ